MKPKEIDPKQESKRRVLRIVGFCFLVPGIVLVFIGLADFFSSLGSFGSFPAKSPGFIFAGMPLIFIGLVCLMYGFMGTMARYQAGEIAPVAKDTINYVADGVEGEVEDLARSVAKGMNSANTAKERILVLCPKCKAKNDEDSKFCKKCGESLT